MARVTQADVAARARVSRTVASFVLTGRNDQRISEETQQRVRDAAAELGYRPNRTANILRTGTSGTVALVSDFIASTSTANALIRGALEGLRSRDKLLFTVETLGRPELEAAMLEDLRDRQVDGVIYASMFTRSVVVPPVIRDLPLVLLNCVSADDAEFATVVPDEIRAGEAAAAALIGAGHRDGIFFVGALEEGMTGGAEWHGWTPLALSERLHGIRRRLAAHGAELAGIVPVADDWDPHNGRRAVERLLRDGARPTALICVNDAVAFGAYQALSAAGWVVPDDVSVVAFDDSQLASWLEPPLSSIALPQDEMGRMAVDLLLDPGRGVDTVRVPMPFRARGSIGVAGPAASHRM
ncbi:LacI family DNA-binding transcriptional regulator [Plantibacter flavus]|uniref:LacI family DNA-binding transcriptional regulator n=1 Tax=Plantibacter flavus TaxID=150123 RepID=UPI003F14C017